MAFVSGLIYMVAHCLKRTSETVYLHSMVYESYVQAETPKEKAQIKKKEKLIPPHDFKFFLPISVLTIVGIFNRPTFALFAFVPLFYWFLRGVANNSIITPFQMFNFRWDFPRSVYFDHTRGIWLLEMKCDTFVTIRQPP